MAHTFSIKDSVVAIQRRQRSGNAKIPSILGFYGMEHNFLSVTEIY